MKNFGLFPKAVQCAVVSSPRIDFDIRTGCTTNLHGSVHLRNAGVYAYSYRDHGDRRKYHQRQRLSRE